MAQFHADVVAYASNASGEAPAAPKCVDCLQVVRGRCGDRVLSAGD